MASGVVTAEETVDDALSFDAPAPRVLERSLVEALSWPMVRPVPSAARPAAGRGYTGAGTAGPCPSAGRARRAASLAQPPKAGHVQDFLR
jgi:hypothetical protein